MKITVLCKICLIVGVFITNSRQESISYAEALKMIKGEFLLPGKSIAMITRSGNSSALRAKSSSMPANFTRPPRTTTQGLDWSYWLTHSLFSSERPRDTFKWDMSRIHTNRVMVRLMQQEVYTAQRKLRDINEIAHQFALNHAFRMGIIFQYLDQLKLELDSMLTAALGDSSKRDIPIAFLYTHFVKKNIEVTYILEYLLVYHQSLVDRLFLRNAAHRIAGLENL